MAAIKGHKKAGGREKGTLNRQTAELRQFISGIIYENMPKIRADIEALEPERRIAIFEKLLSYVLPKPQAAEFPTEAGLMTVRSGNSSWVISASEDDLENIPSMYV